MHILRKKAIFLSCTDAPVNNFGYYEYILFVAMTSKREHISRLKQKIKDMQHQLSKFESKPNNTGFTSNRSNQYQRKPIFTSNREVSPVIRRSGSCIRDCDVQKWNTRKRDFSQRSEGRNSAQSLSPQKQHIADLLYQRFYQPKQSRRSPSRSSSINNIMERVDKCYFNSRQGSVEKDDKTILRQYNSSSLLNCVQSSLVPKIRSNPIVNPESSPYRPGKKTLKIETSPVRLLEEPPSNENIQRCGDNAFVMQHKGAANADKNISKVFIGQIESPKPSGKKHFSKYFVDTHSWRTQVR